MLLTEIKRQKGASYILQIPPLRLETLAKPMVNISLSLSTLCILVRRLLC